MICPSTVPFSSRGAVGFTSTKPSPVDAFLNEYTNLPSELPRALMRDAENTMRMMTTSMISSPVPMPPMQPTVPQVSAVRNLTTGAA